MNTNVSFRQMESSPALREYATSKLDRIVEKYVPGHIDADVVMSVEKFWHIANFTIQIKNLTVKGRERSEDMYSSIDLALAKIEKQLRRHKDRIRDHKPSSGSNKQFRMGVLSPIDSEEESVEEMSFTQEMDVYSAADVPAADEAPKLSLRQEDFTAQNMTVEQAVVQLDLLSDREFYVFTNFVSGRINIVFTRADGNVGLIET